MRLVSWNVNGIRAVSGKPDWRWFVDSTADIIALQETKARVEQLPDALAHPAGWHAYFCSSTVKKGYSGVAVFSRSKPLSIDYELPEPEYAGEGRLLHLELADIHFLNGYFPNGGSEILDDTGKPTGRFTRLEYKMGFYSAFFRYIAKLRKTKPVVVCGDFNIAHKAIDLARPKQNEGSTGYLKEERALLDSMVQAGYLDTFRMIHGEEKDAYTWWSYKTRARAKNIGWRIDYFFASEELRESIRDAWIEADVLGSDHCPVGLLLT